MTLPKSKIDEGVPIGVGFIALFILMWLLPIWYAAGIGIFLGLCTYWIANGTMER